MSSSFQKNENTRKLEEYNTELRKTACFSARAVVCSLYQDSMIFLLFYLEAMMELTKSELEVMNVLWREGRALSRNEIIALSVHKTWKDSSVHILLNGLLGKGAVQEAGFIRRGKTFGRLYAANISCEKYYAENVFAGSDKAVLPMLFSALIKSDELSPELIAELEDMLEARKEALGGPG